MRAVRIAFGSVAVLAGLWTLAGAANAESFFQKLFGGRSASPPPSFRSFGRFGTYGPGRPLFFFDTPRPAPVSPLYRTVCVRLCDGYYWPVSGATTRGGFYRDASVCKSSCDSEARLFYLPRASDAVDGMTDLAGRSYRHLDQAFGYRTALVDGCSCKPPPWSDTERARHETYAALEAERGTVAPGETVVEPDAPGSGAMAVSVAPMRREAWRPIVARQTYGWGGGARAVAPRAMRGRTPRFTVRAR